MLPNVLGLDPAGSSMSAHCSNTDATNSFFVKRPERSAGSLHQGLAGGFLEATPRCMEFDMFPQTLSSSCGNRASCTISAGNTGRRLSRPHSLPVRP